MFRANGQIETLAVTGPLLGVVDEDQPASPEIELRPGDSILMFTDGIAEATSPHGEQFGNDRIFDAVRQNFNQPAAEIVARIERAALAFRRQIPIEDDVTLLMIKCLG